MPAQGDDAMRERLAEVDRRLKKARKAIDAIADLEKRVAAGDNLEATQLDKVGDAFQLADVATITLHHSLPLASPKPPEPARLGAVMACALRPLGTVPHTRTHMPMCNAFAADMIINTHTHVKIAGCTQARACE